MNNLGSLQAQDKGSQTRNEKATRRWLFQINQKKLITWKQQLWQRQQQRQLPCWQQHQQCQQQRQQQQPWLVQQQKQQLQQQKQLEQVLQQELVQVQELLLFYRKRPKQQQQSQRSKREIYSFEIPSKKIDNFRKLFCGHPQRPSKQMFKMFTQPAIIVLAPMVFTLDWRQVL